MADITSSSYAGVLSAFLAGTPEPFTHDFDGILLSDSRWNYEYDAENRLGGRQSAGFLSTVAGI